MTSIVIILLVMAVLAMQWGRSKNASPRAKTLRQIGLALAVIALALALIDVFNTTLDQPDRETPTLSGDREI